MDRCIAEHEQSSLGYKEDDLASTFLAMVEDYPMSGKLHLNIVQSNISFRATCDELLFKFGRKQGSLWVPSELEYVHDALQKAPLSYTSLEFVPTFEFRKEMEERECYLDRLVQPSDSSALGTHFVGIFNKKEPLHSFPDASNHLTCNAHSSSLVESEVEKKPSFLLKPRQSSHAQGRTT
jgi:hypothetical protein